MIIFNNEMYNEALFAKDDLFFFALGYEHRSYYLYDKISKKLEPENIVSFLFKDSEQPKHAETKIGEINQSNIQTCPAGYTSSDAEKKILEKVTEIIEKRASITLHIDYSSMPRSWYCKLPKILHDTLRPGDKAYFWYTEGEYPTPLNEYPGAGIDGFTFFSGKPSLNVDKNRTHILGLGYDVARTDAIISIIDPTFLVTCYAHNPSRKRIKENIKKANRNTLSRSAISIHLPLDDFPFMISKLRGTANELLSTRSVIFLPDGPKPLVFAMSLIPDLLGKRDVSCLHVKRNSQFYKPVDVLPTGIIYGFSVTGAIPSNLCEE